MIAFESLHNRIIADIRLFELQELFDNMTTSWNFKNRCKSILNMIFDFALKTNLLIPIELALLRLGKRKKLLKEEYLRKKKSRLCGKISILNTAI